MRPAWALSVLLVVVTSLVGSVVASAQTDIAASLYGAFNQSTSGSGGKQIPFNAAGVMIELRHISNPLVGYEVTYSYNRANQEYVVTQPCPAGYTCAGTAVIKSAAHEITGDWVASIKYGKLRPFALAGIGARLDIPSGGTANAQACVTGDPFLCESEAGSVATTTSSKVAFIFGAGLDWTLLPHIGFRFQYRGNVYKAPDLVGAVSTDSFTQTSEPMAGIFLRF